MAQADPALMIPEGPFTGELDWRADASLGTSMRGGPIHGGIRRFVLPVEIEQPVDCLVVEDVTNAEGLIRFQNFERAAYKSPRLSN